MSTYEEVENDAKDYAFAHYAVMPSRRVGAAAGFIAGRTVSAEQVEAAAEDYLGSIMWMSEGDWIKADPQTRHMARDEAQRILRAAGLLIEGADDE